MRDQGRPSRVPVDVISHCVAFNVSVFFFYFVKNFEEIKKFLGLEIRVFATKDWLGTGPWD